MQVWGHNRNKNNGIDNKALLLLLLLCFGFCCRFWLFLPLATFAANASLLCRFADWNYLARLCQGTMHDKQRAGAGGGGGAEAGQLL